MGNHKINNHQRREDVGEIKIDRNEAIERSKLIIQMLDKSYPFEENMPRDVREDIDRERQMLVLRSDWRSLSIEDLRKIANGQ